MEFNPVAKVGFDGAFYAILTRIQVKYDCRKLMKNKEPCPQKQGVV
ncbi:MULTISPECIES: hypothetical protein [Clostridia]|jgi:hypothetical protein|nr:MULTISPECIES: hypothetical protein [Eubacteriales]